MFSASCRIVGARFWLAVLPVWPLAAGAETAFLQPGADTTLIEAAPTFNLGGADFFNAGSTGSGNRNRALVWFDVAGQIPAGAIIESVTLTLDVVRQPNSDPQSSVFGLHRMKVSWGEGAQVPVEEGSPGLGGPAAEGEATWVDRFVGGAAWSTPGGAAGVDFEEAASGAALVFGLGEPVTFEGTDAMVADVQRWLSQPDQNFGWMFMTESEEVHKSARSFASRENGNTGGPLLSIQYAVVPEPGALAIAGLGIAGLGLAGLTRRTARRHRG